MFSIGEGSQAQERTEEPTSKRLEQARDEGQVAKSKEITSLVSILSSVLGFVIFGPSLYLLLRNALISIFSSFNGNPMNACYIWSSYYVSPIVKIIINFSLIGFTGVIVASLAQTGWLMAWKTIQPKLSKLNPLAGIKRLVSISAFVNFLQSLVKVFAIGFIAYWTISENYIKLVGLASMNTLDAIQWSLLFLSTLIIRLCTMLTVMGILDYLYQWYSTKQKLRMTKQDVKDEMKDTQPSETVRVKVKQVAQERAKREIKKNVPSADVIVTNPTHYAVALKYDREKDAAPRVVAKGVDHMAEIIRNIAKQNNVPFYEYPVFARQLYKKVKTGKMIPLELFESAAKVLAFVYQLNKNRWQLRLPKHRA